MKYFNHYLRKSNLLLLLFLLCIFPAMLSAQNSITGKVISNNVAVTEASVFLNSSSTGTKTLQDGTFSLDNVKNGNYDVIISCIGYETYIKNIYVYNKNINLSTIELQRKTDTLAEVKIVAPGKKKHIGIDRTGYIRRFEREFFGSTKNASGCKLLNPDMLDFVYNEEFDKLSATSHGFLIIENRALGYRIKYLLKSFLQDPVQHLMYYTGYYSFEEMDGTPEQQRVWQAERLKTYLGSEMHFLRSCMASDFSNIFTVRKMVREPNPNREPDSVIYANIKLYSSTGGEMLHFWKNEAAKYRFDQKIFNRPLDGYEFLKKTDIKGIYAIGYPDCLVVNYGYTFSTSLKYNTIITFKQPFSYFDSNGIIINPSSILVEGYWGTKRIAELLPVDYEVPHNK